MNPDWLTHIRLPMPGMMGGVNCYLIQSGGSSALIDTGMHDDVSIAMLCDRLSRDHLAPEDIERVICTHCHADHCGLGRYFQKRGASVVLSDTAADALDTYFSHPEYDVQRAVMYNRHDMPKEFEGQVGSVFMQLRNLHNEFRPDETVSDDDIISVGDLDFKVIATPGHTPGHISFLELSSSTLFAGDHLLADGTVHISLSEESYTDDVLGQYMNSLSRIESLGSMPGYAGHGQRITDVKKRAGEVMGFHRARLRRVFEATESRPSGCLELARRVFGDKRKPLTKWLMCAQTLSYLEHLLAEGMVEAYCLSGMTLFFKGVKGDN